MTPSLIGSGIVKWGLGKLQCATILAPRASHGVVSGAEMYSCDGTLEGSSLLCLSLDDQTRREGASIPMCLDTVAVATCSGSVTLSESEKRQFLKEYRNMALASSLRGQEASGLFGICKPMKRFTFRHEEGWERYDEPGKVSFPPRAHLGNLA